MKSTQSTASVSAILRDLAERQQAFEERRNRIQNEFAEVEKEGREIQHQLSELAAMQGAIFAPTGPPLSLITGLKPRPTTPPPGSQLQTILQVLVESGKLTRPELFAKLELTDAQPANPKQLSSLLSRLKNSGYIGFDQDHRWFAIQPTELD
jgi:hypothetical protein